jgi:4-amino-4-deoxy-L-arabinose transferase-like glycosyltransferase
LARSSLIREWQHPARFIKAAPVAGTIDQRRYYSTVPVFVLFFLVLFGLHFSLLRLPYFWDEAGYYVPAARDLLLTGSLIPHSTPSNAHPPLVMAYLALAWKILGYSPVVTRTAMLAVAAFTLLGVFRLAQAVANTQVAVASAICTALYPVFFAQSSMAHIDLAAAGFTFWGLLAYIEERRWATAICFSLAVLTKETAVLTPLALFSWEFLARTFLKKSLSYCSSSLASSNRPRLPLYLLFPLLPLTLWYCYHFVHTGFIFGNPEFFRYNVQATVQPLRVLLALGTRLWQIFGYLNLHILTLVTILAMWLPPLRDERNGKSTERKRIALDVQFSFLAVIAAYVATMAVVGGAVLARYMLPVVPLVIIVFMSTLRRRLRLWPAVVVIVALGFVAALFVNPPYGLSIEDNLAYRDYIELHQNAEDFMEARYPMARVLTAWPANDELTNSYLGYVTRPMRVLRIENFTVEQLMTATQMRANFDVALVFSTKYEPAHPWFERWSKWQEWKTQFFGYHRDAQPAVATQILGGRLVYNEARNGQWAAIIEMGLTWNPHRIEVGVQ